MLPPRASNQGNNSNIMLHRILIASLLLSSALGARPVAFDIRARAAPSALVQALPPGSSAAFAIPRGGAAVGPIDPEAAAKTFGILYLMTGVQSVLSPKSMSKMYGMEEFTGTSTKLLRRNGLALLTIGVHAACLLFKGTDLNTSFGLASLHWAADALASLLNDDSETTGPSKMGDCFALAVILTTAFAGLTNAGWASTAFKAVAVFAIASGLQCMFDPKAAIDSWGMKGDDEFSPGLIAAIGTNTITMGALAASLAWGIDPVKAFGYAAAVHFPLGMYTDFISADFAKLGCDSTALAIWTFLFGAIAAIILL